MGLVQPADLVASLAYSVASLHGLHLDLQDEAEGLGSRLGKNPAAETGFLPDRDRDKREAEVKKQIEREYEIREQVSIIALLG